MVAQEFRAIAFIGKIGGLKIGRKAIEKTKIKMFPKMRAFFVYNDKSKEKKRILSKYKLIVASGLT